MSAAEAMHSASILPGVAEGVACSLTRSSNALERALAVVLGHFCFPWDCGLMLWSAACRSALSSRFKGGNGRMSTAGGAAGVEAPTEVHPSAPHSVILQHEEAEEGCGYSSITASLAHLDRIAGAILQKKSDMHRWGK